MACVLTTGYTLPCKLTAGIQAVYIGSWTNTLAYTLGTASPTLNQIVTFTAGTSSMYTFQQTIETGSLTNNGNFNEQNGTAYYDQIGEITVHNPTQTILDQVTSLGKGRQRLIWLDQNGLYWLQGLQNPVSVTALTGGLGKAYGDLYGYTITFTGKESSPMIQLTTAAALSVIS